MENIIFGLRESPRTGEGKEGGLLMYREGLDQVLAEVKEIMLEILQNKESRVYLFGSWARGDEKRTSDIDIAVDYDGPDVIEVFNRIRFELEESTVPYRVDILDMNKADRNIVNKVKMEGILWKG